MTVFSNADKCQSLYRMAEPGPSKPILDNDWKIAQDSIWRMKIQVHHLIWVGTPVVKNRFHLAILKKKNITDFLQEAKANFMGHIEVKDH